MNYCNNCRRKFETEHNFCPECGVKVKSRKDAKVEYFMDRENYLEPKRRILPWVIGFLLVVAIVIGIGFAIIFYSEEVGPRVYPPFPRVVDVNCEGYGVLDYRMKVTVAVRNDGGAGNVRIIGKLDQTDSRFDQEKEQTVYMSPNEVRTVTFDFDASGFRNSKCSGWAFRV